MSEPIEDLVVPLRKRYLESGGDKLAVDRMAPAQHTPTSMCLNSCSTDYSPSAMIQYSGIYSEINQLQINEALELDSSTSQHGVVKTSKLTLNLASSSNE